MVEGIIIGNKCLELLYHLHSFNIITYMPILQKETMQLNKYEYG